MAVGRDRVQAVGMSDQMEQVVADAIDAMAHQDWDRLRPMLHPYLHWTAGDGGRTRGRTKVLELLATSQPPGPPSSFELRDGQIYRWSA